MPLQKRAIDTATTEEKTTLSTHTFIILTTHCQHPLSLESFTLGKTQCNTKQCYLPWIDLVLITFSRGNIIATSIFSRTVVFISTFSSIKMELFLKQGGVIPSILCTRWDCIINPALDQNLLRSSYTWCCSASQPLQLIM